MIHEMCAATYVAGIYVGGGAETSTEVGEEIRVVGEVIRAVVAAARHV